MKLFISHSHKDNYIVEKFVNELVSNKIYIWIDKFEMEPNQSLKEKIFKALDECSHFCLMISNNSVNSKWCLDELEFAIQKEKEENRKIVIPILIDHCEVPEKINDRVFIDLRYSFEDGMQKLLFLLQNEDSKSHGTKYDTLYKRDFAIDWGILDTEVFSAYYLEVTAVSFEFNKEYSILSKITFTGNEELITLFKEFKKLSIETEFNKHIIRLAYTEVSKSPNNFLIKLNDGTKKEDNFKLIWREKSIEIFANVEIRILGNLPNNDVIFDYGSIIEAINK